MLSVILPTLWKLDFQEQLSKLHESESVGEIILINNDYHNTPDWFVKNNYSKIIEIRPEKNIYVNPAWNLGVSLAKFENIILHSDDVEVKNYNFCSYVDKILTDTDCLIGIDKDCYYQNYDNTKITLYDLSFEERTIGFGCMMFFRKSSYKNIPNDFLIWRGDDFLIALFKHKQKPVYTLKNVNLQGTKISATVDLPEFSWKEEKEGCKHKYLQSLDDYLKN